MAAIRGPRKLRHGVRVKDVADFPDLDKRMVKLRVKLAIYKLSDGKPPA